MSDFAAAHVKTASPKIKLTTINATAVYTCPSSIDAKLIFLRLKNVDASNSVSALVVIFDNSESASYTYENITIAPDESHDIEFHGLLLNAADELRVTAGAANDIHAFVTAVEIQGRGG
jgi:hypothetical protein